MAHDFVKFPELTNRQINEIGFESPHVQITEDFDAFVVRAVDGDTVTLRADFRNFNFPLRLLDIDAKELGEGGKEAKSWMKSRIEGKDVQVKIEKANRVDKYGRLLGKVVHGGMDVGLEELMLGLATSFDRRREEQLPDLNKMFNIRQWL